MLTGRHSDFLKVGVVAAARGDLDAVRELLELKPEWLLQVGSHGRTMLWEATYRGKRDMVRFLAGRGADINARGCHYTPLYVEISAYCAAIVRGRDAIAEDLRTRGAIYEIYDAAYLGDMRAVERMVAEDPTLLERRCPQHSAERPNGDRADYATPLCYAIAAAKIDVARFLIAQGAEVRQHSWHFMKYASGRPDLLRLLLENGADPSTVNPPESEQDSDAAVLAEYGVKADPNATKHDPCPPLVYASRGDRGEHPETIQRLLDAGADIHVRNHYGKTALHVAAKAGFTKTMRVLIDNGADVHARDPEGNTPLIDAVRSTIRRSERQVGAVQLLLEHGADPRAENARGHSPVQVARNGRSDTMKQLAELLAAQS